MLYLKKILFFLLDINHLLYKIYLEKTLGEKLYSFAYPYGIFNETSKKIVKELGFNYGIATDSGKFYIEDDLYQVRRIGFFSDITMSKFKRRVKGNYNLKYIKWGIYDW